MAIPQYNFLRPTRSPNFPALSSLQRIELTPPLWNKILNPESTLLISPLRPLNLLARRKLTELRNRHGYASNIRLHNRNPRSGPDDRRRSRRCPRSLSRVTVICYPAPHTIGERFLSSRRIDYDQLSCFYVWVRNLLSLWLVSGAVRRIHVPVQWRFDVDFAKDLVPPTSMACWARHDDRAQVQRPRRPASGPDAGNGFFIAAVLYVVIDIVRR
jgi:hypothetical protein